MKQKNYRITSYNRYEIYLIIANQIRDQVRNQIWRQVWEQNSTHNQIMTVVKQQAYEETK